MLSKYDSMTPSNTRRNSKLLCRNKHKSCVYMTNLGFVTNLSSRIEANFLARHEIGLYSETKY